VKDAPLPATVQKAANAQKPAAASPATAPAKPLPEKSSAAAPVKAAKPPVPAATASTTTKQTPSAPKPVAPKVNAKPAIQPETKPAVAATDTKLTPVKPVKPSPLDAPRAGGADDLTRIKGLGPKLLRALNRMGVFHIDQIAAWTPGEVAWMDDNIQGFKGRVSRDNWVAQAKALLDEKPSG
jgi:NADH-quinone oxidoreductase subunit E